MHAPEINLMMGNPNENCLHTCQQHEGVCIDDLQGVFDTCDHHETLHRCKVCKNGKIAGFEMQASDNMSEEKICIKLTARTTNENLCNSPTATNFRPLCACQMKPLNAR